MTSKDQKSQSSDEEAEQDQDQEEQGGAPDEGVVGQPGGYTEETAVRHAEEINTPGTTTPLTDQPEDTGGVT